MFASYTATAQVSTTEYFGLAMHGDAKHDATSQHYDYATPDAPKGGTLKQATIGSFDTLNPYTLKGKSATGLNLIYDRLMARSWDEAFTLYPLIAERVEMPKSRKSITFHLNKNARFHDGTPITADDVIFSHDILKQHGRPNMRRIYALATKITKRNDHTVTFRFSFEKDEETAMIFAMMPVLSEKYWKDRDFTETTLTPPLSNGPYKIKSVDPGKSITYERVKDYWAKDLLPNVGHNNFDTLTHEYFRDETIAFEAFKKGDLDLHQEKNITRWITGYDFDAIKNGQIKQSSFTHKAPAPTKAIIFNTRRAPLDNLTVRKYLIRSFDFDWINANLYHDQYKQISSYFPNTDLGYNSIEEKDKEKAFKILLGLKNNIPPEAMGPGWSSNPGDKSLRFRLREASDFLLAEGYDIKDNILVHRETNTPLTFSILVNNDEDKRIALSYKRTLKKLGIAVEIDRVDRTQFTNRIRSYNYDAIIHKWNMSLSPGTEQYLYWSCESATTQGRLNYPGVCDQTADKLIKDLNTAKDRPTLVSNIRALDQVLLYGHYMIPLNYTDKINIGHKTNLQHPDKAALYGPVTETWWQK